MAILRTSPPSGGGADGPSELRVINVEIAVDPDTLDRIFTVHSEERAPIALRVSPVDLAEILASLESTVARSLN